METDLLTEARALLGATLTHDDVSVRITEVEAYHGPYDPASHAFRGPTARNAVMFGQPGHLYVYFTYGMHFCANVVVSPAGEAAAVLLRAGEVVTGIETARARRSRSTDRDLARGPARLTKALAIDRGYDGADLRGPDLVLIAPPESSEQISAGPRVGVSTAADVPWRFWITGDPTVSVYRRSPRAPEVGGP